MSKRKNQLKDAQARWRTANPQKTKESKLKWDNEMKRKRAEVNMRV